MSNRRPEQDWAGGEGRDEPSLVEQIKLLSDALAGTSVTELEMEEGGLRIRLQRQPIAMQPVVFAAGGAGVAVQPASGAPPAEDAAAEMTVAVLAPLTGVFYTSASPDLPPFVVPGDKVQPGQVVCMVEAMKVFNEIKTEIGGVVTAIPPKNNQLVKKGDPLVRIKPY